MEVSKEAWGSEFEDARASFRELCEAADARKRHEERLAQARGFMAGKFGRRWEHVVEDNLALSRWRLDFQGPHLDFQG